jgi:hypothetical protein
MLAAVLRPTAIALAVLTFACSKSAVPTPPPEPSAPPASSSSSSSSASPAWLAFAVRAPVVGESARAARTGPARKPPKLAEIDAVFDRMTKEPETADGLRAAAKLLEDARPLASDPKWAGSGSSPGAALLHHGGLALLVDLAQRACAAKPGDAAVGAAADTIPLPRIFDSGGVDRGNAARDRHIVQEAARACGSSAGP